MSIASDAATRPIGLHLSRETQQLAYRLLAVALQSV